MTPEERVDANIGLLHHVARKMIRRTSSNVELDDMVNAGFFGLLSAAQTFEESRGHTFSTYAIPRIRGAIMDDMRRNDHATRTARHHSRKIREAENRLSQKILQRPHKWETAAYMGIDIETFYKWEANIEWFNLMPITYVGDDGIERMVDDTALICDIGVDVMLQEEDMRNAVLDIIEMLQDQDRRVIVYYYFYKMKLSKIGDIMGLTESRISQVRARALKRARSYITFRP